MRWKVCAACLLGGALPMTMAHAALSDDAAGAPVAPPILQGIDGFYLGRLYAHVDRVDEGPLGKKIVDQYEQMNRLRLRADLRLDRTVSGALSLDAELNYGINDASVAQHGRALRLWEAYVDVDSDRLGWRVGRQVIRWGAADQVNIIDNFTPQDLREFLNFSREDRKWPVWAVKSKLFLGDERSLETIWIPAFEPSLIAGNDETWEFFIRRNYVKGMGLALQPEHKPQRGVIASKLSFSGQDGDVSFSYVYHPEQIASFNADLANHTVSIEYPRQHSLGFDFEKTRGGVGYRGEVVYTTNKPYATFDLTVPGLTARKPTLQGVFGADYTFKSQAYVNVQLTTDYIFHHEALMQPLKFKKSLVLLLRQPFLHEKWAVEFQARAFLGEVDAFYRLALTDELSDSVTLMAGAAVFRGDDYGLFGQYRNNNQLFFKLKHDFKQ